MYPTTTVPTTVVEISKETEDGKVSVIDVISQIKKCSANYAAQIYQRLLIEERVPTCEVRSIAQRTSEGSTARCTRPRTSTPIASAAEIIEVIWQIFARTVQKSVCVILVAMNRLWRRSE